ncbi:cytochrome P450 [Nocardioides ultimimeridianus]
MLKLSEGASHAGGARRAAAVPLVRAEHAVKKPVRWLTNHGIARVMITRSAKRGELQGRLIGETKGGDHRAVLELFDEVRSHGTTYQGTFSLVTVDHATVKAVLNSPDFLTGMPSAATGWLMRAAQWAQVDVLNPVAPPSLLVTDGADHTRYRKLVTRVFSVKAVAALRTRTEEIASALLDDLAAHADGPVDLVERYCALLPVTVISEILGVPESERERVLEFGAAAAPSLDLGLTWGQFREVESALEEFDTWLGAHLESLRRNPGDDLLSKLVAAREEGVGLTDLELRSIAGLVLAAGFETTVNLLSNGIALLCEHPDQLALLRERPDLWPNAVDEVLRHDPPVLLTGRFCSQDTDVAGTTVKRGTLVTTVLAGANRDPQVFPDPDRFDVARENAHDHVSFSSGRHYCLGASLARMEGEVGMRALVDRFPDLRLLPGAERRSTRILRGWENLPASLG